MPFVKVASDDDASVRGAEVVEQVADLTSDDGQVAGVDTDRAEASLGEADGRAYRIVDVVGVDEQGCLFTVGG